MKCQIIDIHYLDDGYILLFTRDCETRQAVTFKYPWTSYFYLKGTSNYMRSRLQPYKVETVMAKGFDDGFNDHLEEFTKYIYRNERDLRKARYRVKGVQLYESDVDPRLRFIHDTGLDPSGIIEFDPSLYSLRDGMYVWQSNTQPVWTEADKVRGMVPVHLIASFDLECVSRSGEFPLAIKSVDEFWKNMYEWRKKVGGLTREQWRTLFHILQHPSYTPLNIHGWSQDINQPSSELSQYIVQFILPTIEHILSRSFLYTKEGLWDLARIIVASDLPNIDLIGPEFTRPLTDEEIDSAYDTPLRQPGLRGDPITEIGTVIQWSDQPYPCEKTIFILGSCNGFTNSDLIELENAVPHKEHKVEVTVDADREEKRLRALQAQHAQDQAQVRIYSFSNEYDEFETVLSLLVRYLDRNETTEQCMNYLRIHRRDPLSRLFENPEEVVQGVWNAGVWKINNDSPCPCPCLVTSNQSINDLVIAIVNAHNTQPNVHYLWGHEREMLLAWRNYIQSVNPDIITGYNIFSFDYNYVYNRAAQLSISTIGVLSKLRGFNSTELLKLRLSSSALGDNIMSFPCTPGRVSIDMYKFVQKEYALESYKLDDVALHFLYKEKADVPPSEIFRRQFGDADDRKSIAMYCVLDCILPIQLMRSLDTIQKNIAMSNVCRIPFSFLFTRGQGIKVYSLIVNYAHTIFPDEKILINTIQTGKSSTGYEGAIVFEPVQGFHTTPTAVGDFNSLYPNSMIARNISHDMILDRGVYKGREDELIARGYRIEHITYNDTTESGDTVMRDCAYVQANACEPELASASEPELANVDSSLERVEPPHARAGLLPEILKKLLQARKDVRKEIAKETNPLHRNVLETMQLAYKITANSLYGQTGASTSKIFRKEIAASTTAVGRQMLLTARRTFESLVGQTLTIADRFDPTRTREIYIAAAETRAGDTDSCMTSWKCIDPMTNEVLKGDEAIWTAMQVCQIACNRVNAIVPAPEHIAFEKVICPFAIFAKKRYHGHYYMEDAFKNDPAHPKYIVKSMGIVLKRRDNAPLLKDIYNKCLENLMCGGSIDSTFDILEHELQTLDKRPIDDYVITKTLRMDYKQPNIAHFMLAKRQAERDPGNRFDTNDRVPYVFFWSPDHTKSTLQGDRVETPEYMQRYGYQVDYCYYIQHQLRKPLEQIFVDLLNESDRFNELMDHCEAKYTREERKAKRQRITRRTTRKDVFTNRLPDDE